MHVKTKLQKYLEITRKQAAKGFSEVKDFNIIIALQNIISFFVQETDITHPSFGLKYEDAVGY